MLVNNDYVNSMDMLGGDFNTIWTTLHNEREQLAAKLADPETNKWTRKRILGRITQLERCEQALLNITGAMEDACGFAVGKDPDFVPVTKSVFAD